MSDVDLVEEIEQVDIEAIEPYPLNPKEHPKEQIKKLSNSIQEYGFSVPIILDEDNMIIAGHGRLEAAKNLEMDKIPAIKKDNLSDTQARAFRLADNRTSESEWDFTLLADEILALDDGDFDLEQTGFDMDEIEDMMTWTPEPDEVEEENDKKNNETEKYDTLHEQYIIPPFSVLNQKKGYWKKRRKLWYKTGINPIEGREKDLQEQAETPEYADDGMDYFAPSTSVFDPVLAEVSCEWFCPQGGSVIDPFSGGDVRGVVSGITGRDYTGFDVRKEQIVSNKKRVKSIMDYETNNDLTEIENSKKSAKKFNSLVDPYRKEGKMGYIPMGAYKKAAENGNIKFVKNKKGEIVGGIYYGTKNNEILVKQVAVSENGNGYGSKLLKGIEKIAKKNYKIVVIDDVRDEKAKNFYEKNGFHVFEGKDESLRLSKYIPSGEEGKINYICGDIRKSSLNKKHDFMITCPPYYNLEKYSDNPDDISTISSYSGFIDEYKSILEESIRRLKNNSFICIVVGDIRGHNGYYRCFPERTINICRSIGLKLYNHFILSEFLGTAKYRVGNYFGNRKVPKVHQRVQVFVKGKYEKAVEKLGCVERWENMTGQEAERITNESRENEGESPNAG